MDRQLTAQLNFSQRSYKKELLDRSDIPFNDIRQNMQELDFINTYLGGHNITLKGVKTLMYPHLVRQKKFSICEIGCGGGDNLLAIDTWCKGKSIEVSYIGIDINEFCIKVAVEKTSRIEAQFIASDYKLTSFTGEKPDLIFSSLFCHHFTNEELIFMLQWMKTNARIGFFINDLHRHPLAFYSIKLLTQIFSRSYLVRNDAPLSVLRGFSRKEWESLLKGAGIRQYEIRWKWAFRYLVTVSNQEYKSADSL